MTRRPLDPEAGRRVDSTRRQQGGRSCAESSRFSSSPCRCGPRRYPFLAKKLSPAEADLKALQGEWDVVRCSAFSRGRVASEPTDGWTTTIDEALFTIWHKGIGERWRITLGPPRRPGELDLVCHLGLNSDERKCIYRLQADTLTLGWPSIKDGVAGRPPALDSDGVTTLVFKRRKP